MAANGKSFLMLRNIFLLPIGANKWVCLIKQMILRKYNFYQVAFLIFSLLVSNWHCLPDREKNSTLITGRICRVRQDAAGEFVPALYREILQRRLSKVTDQTAAVWWRRILRGCVQMNSPLSATQPSSLRKTNKKVLITYYNSS